jgi:hypothetical protein
VQGGKGIPVISSDAKKKENIGNLKVYDEPRSPFQRLMESGELSRERKDALATQCALYNPVQLQQPCQQGYLALASAACSGKPYSDAGAAIATVTFSK